jgi:hypothetical protein
MLEARHAGKGRSQISALSPPAIIEAH